MSATLTILDVGHGNCSILNDHGKVTVIDAGKGPFSTFYLESIGVKELDLVVISHADEDHLAGIIGILSSEQFIVKEVALNADAAKDTKIWRDVRGTLESLHNKGRIKTTVGVFRGGSSWQGEKTSLDVLAPSLSNVLSGAGGRDKDGNDISSNSGSIVLRVTHSQGKSALLAADMEEQTLEEMISHGCDLSAAILVFPHHGGRPGKGDPQQFSERLLDAVDPFSVIFSNGREKHGNPRPEVVDKICGYGVGYLACTQISKNCHNSVLKQADGTLHPSLGAENGRACAGTIELDLTTGRPSSNREITHITFVQSLQSPMCQKNSTWSAASVKPPH